MAPHRRLLYDTNCYDDSCFLPPLPSPSPSPFWSTSPSPSPSPLLALSPGSVVDAASPTLHAVPGSKHDVRRTLFIAVAALLATCALFLTYYIALRRHRSHRRGRGAPEAPPPPPHSPSDPEDELRRDLLEEPYHVWHIRTVGLDDRSIGAISAVAFRRGEGLVEGTDCAVCLGEFRDGEMLRLLPKCSHAFHIPCIDTWLRSHLNCPLCRAPILAPPSPPPPPPPAAASNPPFSSPPPSSAAAEVGDPPVPEESEEAWVRIDLGSGGSEDAEGHRVGSGAPPAEDRGNGRAMLQHVRRSVSMDPSALGGLLRRMGLAGGSGEDSHGRKPTSEEHPLAAKDGGGEGVGCGGVPAMDAGPVEMERSMSIGGGGGRLLLSRFSGRARGGTPPL